MQLFGDDEDEDSYDIYEREDDGESDFFDELPLLPGQEKEPFVFHGHAGVIAHLQQLMNHNKMPHALLFAGEQGIGKHTLARCFAHSLLTGKKTIAVEEDAVMSRMLQGSHGDFLAIAAQRNDKGKQGAIGVDQIREIGAFLSKTPGEASLRVVLIDEAEAMNTNAANALLKNLEEPPAHTLMLLVSHNPAALLPTIRSRVQVVKFSPLSPAECTAIMQQHAHASPVMAEASMEDIALLSHLAEARPGLALQWLAHGGADIYRAWLTLLCGSDREADQLAQVAAFAENLMADKQAMHIRMEMFSQLLLLFIKRVALAEMLTDEQEQQAAAAFRAKADPAMMIECWFGLKHQFSLVEQLHLEYKNVLITLLLRLVRGQTPLELVA